MSCLQLFGTILQCDISIIKECNTLRELYSQLISVGGQEPISILRNKNKLVRNDECTMSHTILIFDYLMCSFAKVVPQTLAPLYGSQLVSLVRIMRG